jgi:hypothetical protein
MDSHAPDHAVAGDGGEHAPVGRERHGRDVLLVALEHVAALPRGCVPHARRRVRGRRAHHALVRGEAHRRDAARVALHKVRIGQLGLHERSIRRWLEQATGSTMQGVKQPYCRERRPIELIDAIRVWHGATEIGP